jgi:hypothetical protein
LRADKLGRPIDANGKRVPASALASPAPKPRKPKVKPRKPKVKPRKPKVKPRKPKAKPRKRAPKPAPQLLPPKKRRRRAPANIFYVPDGAELSNKQLISSDFDNSRSPRFIAGTLFNWIGKKARKANYTPDDITIYQYGIQIINTSQSGDVGSMAPLMAKMAREYPMFTFKWDENSVRVLLGQSDEPTSRRAAYRILEALNNEIQDIWGYLNDMWDGDIGWFAIAENDELQGRSD